MAAELELPVARGHKWMWLVKAVGWPLITLLGPTRYSGASRVPRSGGLIVIANHLSDCDPVVLQGCCPRPIYFMSKSELFSMKVVGTWLRFWGAFPVKRGAPDRRSLRIASELARSGQVVGIFPEGMLSETGRLQEIREGAALIVRMSEVPVICCGLRNTNRMVPYGSMIPRPALGVVSATWGEARTFGKDATNEEIAAWMESELRRVIPEPSV